MALCLGAAGPVVAAQSPAEATLEAIAEVRSRAVDPQRPAAERLQSAEALLDLRARLIAEQRDDPRRAVWLADQATDLLLVLLPIDASGLTSLFGLPSPDQRARARRVARQVSDLAAEAELEIERAIVAIEATPGYADDVAAQMRRRRLVEGQRERRIPFLRGAGACLDAALGGGDPGLDEARYRLAAEQLQGVLPLLAGRPAYLARLYAGLALQGLGEHEAAQAVLDASAPDPRADPLDLFAIQLARVLVSARRAGPAAGLDALDALAKKYDRPDDLFFQVLIADQRFLLHRDAARQADAARRRALLVHAFDAYLDLLDDPPGSDGQAMRVIVLDRLTRAVDADTPLGRLPAMVSVARARQLAAQAPTRPEAIALLHEVLARGDLEPADRAEALDGLGRALLAEQELDAAARCFGRLARDHATSRHAEPAVVLAVTIATELYRRNSGEPESALLRSTLDLLLDRYPNLASIDRWRCAAAGLALAEGRHQRAVSLFEQVPPNAPQWLEAQRRRAGALRAWARAEPDAAMAQQRWLAVLDAADTVEPAVRRALAAAGDAAATRDLTDALAVLAVYRAEARLAGGDPAGALAALERVGDDSGAATDALLIRIDAYTALGRADAVDRALGRLLTVAGPRAGALLYTMLEARRDTSDPERRLVPVARALVRWLLATSGDDGERARLELAAADAFRRAAHWPDALGLYDGLLSRYPHALEPLLGRAECLFALGDDHLADAMLLYRRIAEATAGRSDDAYWQSQLRMLQILSRTGRNTQRIAPHIQRLRQKDPGLGGERYRREFERLQSRHPA